MRWRERHTLVLATWVFAAVVALELVRLILAGFVVLAMARGQY